MKSGTLTEQNGKAVTVKKTFSRETAVNIEIKAGPAIIWSLLTNSSGYPRWNSTVITSDSTNVRNIMITESIDQINATKPVIYSKVPTASEKRFHKLHHHSFGYRGSSIYLFI